MKLKGCQKKIVCMKNVDGRIFEEAFFILKEDGGEVGDGDILTEANRLLARNTLPPASSVRASRAIHLRDFLFGALSSALLCFLYLVFLN